MDYIEDILARLQRGEDVDAIASDITNSINEAHARYMIAEEAKRQEAEKLKEAGKRKFRIAAMSNFISALVDLLAAYEFDNETLDAIDNTDPVKLVDDIDETLPIIQEYMELFAAAHELREQRALDAAEVRSENFPAGGSFEDFLNKHLKQ